MVIKETFSDKIFNFFNVLLTILINLIVLYPLIYILSASFSDPMAVMNGEVVLTPVDFTFAAYQKVFQNEDIVTGYLNSIQYTIVGTAVNLVMTVLGAYPLSRKDFYGRNVLTAFFAFTMFFGGGMIPTYLVIQDLGLLNNFWVMILPGAVSVWSMVIVRTFFQSSIPDELREAAVEHDERKRLVDQTTDLLAGTDGRRYDQPVDLLGAEQADHPVLPLGLRLGTANHQRIAVLFHFHLDLARHLRVKRIGNRRQDQADHARLARIQAAGQQIRTIIELLGAARNPLLRGGADPLFVRAARQHPRNRRLRQIQRLGYVLERSPHTFGTT